MILKNCSSFSPLMQNYKRVAVVWMDEFAEYIYKRRPSYRNLDPGNLLDWSLLSNVTDDI